LSSSPFPPTSSAARHATSTVPSFASFAAAPHTLTPSVPSQAPGTDEEERAWAHRKFGFEFPVMDHVAVLDKATPMWAGPTEISPVYRFLKEALPGEIPWNYTKARPSR
jgi:hypothetical protein